MPVQPVIHPAAHTLVAFGSGQLDDAAAEAVVVHLETCPECRKVVDNMAGDSFLDRLRAAHVRGTTTVPSEPLPGVTPANTPAVSTLPPELRDHEQYEVVRELGRGGMGVVYLARNRLMDRLEALKVVHKQSLDQPGMAERFLREIRSAARLSHPNIVPAYAALQVGGLLVFAMEYVEGEDLARLVADRGPLSVANACDYTRHAALGLQHAFEKGMVHRDIKPHNLILARDGNNHVIKVLDFGLAKVTREKQGPGHDLSGLGMMMGTPDYIAPEQTVDATKADIRADIYSLGCTLYFLLTGSPPFQAKSQFELLQAHQASEAKPLHQIREEVPAELAEVVARMMAKDPALRYQQPVDVAQALAPFVEGRARPLLSSSQAEEDIRLGTSRVPAAGEKGEVNQEDGEEAAFPGRARSEKRRKQAVAGHGRQRRAKTSRRWLFGIGVGVPLLMVALIGRLVWLVNDSVPLPTEGIVKQTGHSVAWVLVCSDQPAGNGNNPKGLELQRLLATGTGSLVDKKRKLLLTAFHVLSGRKEAQVFFAQFDKDGREIASQDYYRQNVAPIRAQVVVSDSKLDLAVLELDSVPDGVHELRLAAQSPATSQTVHTLSNPAKALGGALWGYNQGHVRHVGRRQISYQGGQEVDAWMVMTENPINSGDAGGPLVNDQGELVGVCSADNSDEKVSYFIDVREIRAILARLPP